MALSKDDIKAAYPIPVYNYRVDVGAATMAPVTSPESINEVWSSLQRSLLMPFSLSL